MLNRKLMQCFCQHDELSTLMNISLEQISVIVHIFRSVSIKKKKRKLPFLYFFCTVERHALLIITHPRLAVSLFMIKEHLFLFMLGIGMRIYKNLI